VCIDANDAAIVRAAIVMAQELKIDVIAEGVETPEQLEFLRSRACHVMQGHLFGEAVPAERFEEMVRAERFYPAPPA